MTDNDLLAWARDPKPHDDRVFVGVDVTIADVKTTVRQLVDDVAAECEAMALQLHGMEQAARRAADAFAAAADNVRRARESLRTCPPERYKRVEREATLDHYLDKLLDILPSAEPPIEPGTVTPPVAGFADKYANSDAIDTAVLPSEEP